MGNELAEQLIAARKQIEVENREGGALKDLPCPFCHLPRCLRSNYLRCQKCGVNWWEGTDLTRNPHAKPAPTGSMTLKLVSGTVVRWTYTDPKSNTSVEKFCDVAVEIKD